MKQELKSPQIVLERITKFRRHAAEARKRAADDVLPMMARSGFLRTAAAFEGMALTLEDVLKRRSEYRQGP